MPVVIDGKLRKKNKEVAKRLKSKRCEKYRVANDPMKASERIKREQVRQRKIHKSRATQYTARNDWKRNEFSLVKIVCAIKSDQTAYAC